MGNTFKKDDGNEKHVLDEDKMEEAVSIQAR